MILPSAANLREHWRERHRRIKAQRNAVALAMPVYLLHHERNWVSVLGKLLVTLTRVSPRELDDDNLQGAFKGIRDQVAAQLGLDDRDKRIGWHYAQAKPLKGAPPSVRIEVTMVDAHPEHEGVPF